MSASYDNQGLRTAFTDRDGHSSVTAYNTNGDPVSVEDALGNLKTMTWDEDLDKQSETDALGSTTSYAYDGAGHLTQLTDPMGHSRTTEPVGMDFGVSLSVMPHAGADIFITNSTILSPFGCCVDH